MKVYIVDINIPFNMVVIANNEDEARKTAEEHVEAELRVIDASYEAIIGRPMEITKAPSEWEDSAPYVSPSIARDELKGPMYMTVLQWIEKLKRP